MADAPYRTFRNVSGQPLDIPAAGLARIQPGDTFEGPDTLRFSAGVELVHPVSAPRPAKPGKTDKAAG